MEMAQGVKCLLGKHRGPECRPQHPPVSQAHWHTPETPEVCRQRGGSCGRASQLVQPKQAAPGLCTCESSVLPLSYSHTSSLKQFAYKLHSEQGIVAHLQHSGNQGQHEVHSEFEASSGNRHNLTLSFKKLKEKSLRKQRQSDLL